MLYLPLVRLSIGAWVVYLPSSYVRPVVLVMEKTIVPLLTTGVVVVVTVGPGVVGN